MVPELLIETTQGGKTTAPLNVDVLKNRSDSACLNSFTPRDKETAGGLNR